MAYIPVLHYSNYFFYIVYDNPESQGLIDSKYSFVYANSKYTLFLLLLRYFFFFASLVGAFLFFKRIKQVDKVYYTLE